jgi:hypothetical protein
MIIPQDSHNAQGDDAAPQENQDHFFSDRHRKRYPKNHQILSRSAVGIKKSDSFFSGFFSLA